MDMRTRIERKLDKLMAQKRKNWEIEAKLKVTTEEPMEWTENQEIETESVLKPNEIMKRKYAKKSNKQKIKPKPIPRVQMSKGKETQTLLQRNCEFKVIGSGKATLKADSAGHKLDTCYVIRTKQRIKLMNALMSRDVPAGAINAMSIATRIESAIFRVLSHDSPEYDKYCEQCTSFIEKKRNIRHDLLMGRLDGEEFAFIPSNSSDLQDKIHMRIKWKAEEEKEKLKQLKKGIF